MQNSVQASQSIQATQSSTSCGHAYTITRSPTSFQKFNVVAVGPKGGLLATVKVDLDFEDAAIMVEALNASIDKATESAKDAE